MSTRRKQCHGDPRKGSIVPQTVDSEGHSTVLLEGPNGPAVERVCDMVLRSFRGPCPPGDLRDDNLTSLRYVEG